MTSSVNAPRQRMYNETNYSVSAERLNSASFSSTPARLQSNQQSETPVLSGHQMQDTSEVDIEIKTTQREREEMEGRQRKEEQGALSEIRKELEDITGFGSYEVYLQSFDHDPMYSGRSYIEILNDCFHSPRDTGCGVDVIDVSNEDSSPVGVSLRCENLSASEVCRALCHPPPNTRAQIVLWPITEYTSNVADFLDVLGVGLRLDPTFFRIFRYPKYENESDPYYRSKNSLSIRSLRTNVFVARSFVLARDNPVPVVLISGPMDTNARHFRFWRTESSATCRAIYDLVQAAPLYGHYRCDDDPRLANAYIRALFSLLKSGRDSAPSSSDILSACIIPLLQIEIAVYTVELDRIRRAFAELKDNFCDQFYLESFIDHGLQDEAPEYLYQYRTQLRSSVVYFENQECALMSLLKSSCGPSFTEGLFYPQIKEARISFLKEARLLEAEIRDHLQLQGSKLALEESKKSIELSNNQIYESKRVKIFTVLAFFYIPLNLATSVFGMNLQQLNRSGTSIGVFLGTAGILLLVTGILWLFLESLQNARVLVSRFEEDRQPDPPRNPSVFLRLYLIWWLSTNGWFVWMISTGAGWCILTHSSIGFQSCDHGVSDMDNIPAYEFVLRQMPTMKHNRWNFVHGRGGWLFRRKDDRASSPALSYNSSIWADAPGHQLRE